MINIIAHKANKFETAFAVDMKKYRCSSSEDQKTEKIKLKFDTI